MLKRNIFRNSQVKNKNHYKIKKLFYFFFTKIDPWDRSGNDSYLKIAHHNEPLNEIER